jgi:hypothetical protein
MWLSQSDTAYLIVAVIVVNAMDGVMSYYEGT